MYSTLVGGDLQELEPRESRLCNLGFLQEPPAEESPFLIIFLVKERVNGKFKKFIFFTDLGSSHLEGPKDGTTATFFTCSVAP